MLVHVSAKNIDRIWDRMVPGLSRALEDTTLGEFWDLESARELIEKGALLAFHQPASGYSGVYSFNQTPKALQLTFFWSGKTADNDVQVDWEEVDAYLTHIAEVFECSHIQCEGRVGWKKIVEPLGYHVDGSLYLKRIT